LVCITSNIAKYAEISAIYWKIVKLHNEPLKLQNKGNFDGFIKIRGTPKKHPYFQWENEK